MSNNKRLSIKQKLENCVIEAEELQASDSSENQDFLEAITIQIDDILSNYVSYEGFLKRNVLPDLMVRVFKICAGQLLAGENRNDDHFCSQAERLLSLSCPEVAETEEYSRLLEVADQLASFESNTLTCGDTIDSFGSHLSSLPLLLQSFARASGQVVRRENFTAGPVDLDDHFNSCVIIRPKDGNSVLAIGRDCLPYKDIQKSLEALGILGSKTLG